MSLQHIPEFTHRCVDSRSIYLVWRDCTMDHVARFAIHKETNVCTGWRFCIGFLWKYCCLHASLLKSHLLTHAGIITADDLYFQNSRLTVGVTGAGAGVDSAWE